MPPGIPEDLVAAINGTLTAGLTFIQGIPAMTSEATRAATQAVASAIKEGVRVILGPAEAGNIDTSGDIFAFIGSLQDVIIDERLLTSGPLTFAQVLQYENRLSWMRTVIVLASFAFSLIVETVTLGQVEGFVGLLIHMVDDVVADAAKVVSTQLVRKAVAEPFTAGYARIHRNEVLSAGDAEEAFAGGMITEAVLTDTLVSHGFNDAAIQTKVSLARLRAFNQAGIFPIRTKFLPPATLEAAFRAGILTDSEYVKELARQGYDDDALAVIWGLAQLKAVGVAPRAPTLSAGTLSRAFEKSIISEATFRGRLAALGYAQDDIAVLVALAVAGIPVP